MEPFDCPDCGLPITVLDSSLGVEQVCQHCGRPVMALRQVEESLDVPSHAARLPMGPLAALWLSGHPDAAFGLVGDTILVSQRFASGEDEDSLRTWAFLNSRSCDEIAAEVSRVLNSSMPYEGGIIRSCITHDSSGRRRSEGFQIPYEVSHWIVSDGIPGSVETIRATCVKEWRRVQDLAKSWSIWIRPFWSSAPKVRVLSWDGYENLEGRTGLFRGVSQRRIARLLKRHGAPRNPETVFRERFSDFVTPSVPQLLGWAILLMAAMALIVMELWGGELGKALRGDDQVSALSFVPFGSYLAFGIWAAAKLWKGIS